MVCVETATKTHGAFLAVPPDVAETSAAGRHTRRRRCSDGSLTALLETVTPTVNVDHSRSTSRVKKEKCLRWRASRGAVTLTVRAARADWKRRTRVGRGGGDNRQTLPALVVVHRPGISTACSPEEGYVLVMEREVKEQAFVR